MTGWLVLGGGGRLGSALMQRAPAGSEAPPSQCLDLCDTVALTEKIDTMRPCRVINCAALTDVDGCEAAPDRATEINGKAVGRLAQLCTEREIQLCQVSTDYVLSGENLLTEHQDYAPINVYGESKALGEQLCLKANPDHLVVRVQWLFGGGRGDFVRFVRERSLKGDLIPVIHDQVSIPSYTVDLARWMAMLFEVNASGIVHLANGGETSRWDQALSICEHLGHPPRLKPVSWDDLGRPAARPRRSVLDTAHAVALTGHLFEVTDRFGEQASPRGAAGHPRSWRSAQEDWLEQLGC